MLSFKRSPLLLLGALGAMASCRLTASLDDFTSGGSVSGNAGAGGIDASAGGAGGLAADAQVPDGSGGDAGGAGGSAGGAAGAAGGGKDGGGDADADSGDASQISCASGQCVGACKSCNNDAGTFCDTDTDSNPNNCGACGHSCQGSTCVGGACQPVTIIKGLATPWGVVADETNVYWAEEGTASLTGSLSSIPVKGGTTKVLAGTQASPLFVVADDTHIFWANFSDGGSIRRVKKDGTGYLNLTTAGGPSGLTLTATDVAYSSGSDKALWTILKDGGSAQSLVPTQTGMSPKGLVVDTNNVFWADAGLGSIMVKRGSSPATVLVAKQTYPNAVAIDDTYVYWANVGTLLLGDCTESNGSIMRAKKLDGSDLTPIAVAQSCPQGLVLVGTRLYWANAGTKHSSYDLNGAIMTAPVTGGAAKSIATGQTKPWGIAVNKTFLFWTNQGIFAGEGSLQRLPL